MKPESAQPANDDCLVARVQAMDGIRAGMGMEAPWGAATAAQVNRATRHP